MLFPRHQDRAQRRNFANGAVVL